MSNRNSNGIAFGGFLLGSVVTVVIPFLVKKLIIQEYSKISSCKKRKGTIAGTTRRD